MLQKGTHQAPSFLLLSVCSLCCYEGFSTLQLFLSFSWGYETKKKNETFWKKIYFSRKTFFASFRADFIFTPKFTVRKQGPEVRIKVWCALFLSETFVHSVLITFAHDILILIEFPPTLLHPCLTLVLLFPVKSKSGRKKMV